MLLSIHESNKTHQVFLNKDSAKSDTGRFTAELLRGNVLRTADGPGEISEYSSKKKIEVDKTNFSTFDPSKSMQKISFRSKGENVSATHFLINPKDLALEKPNISVKKNK